VTYAYRVILAAVIIHYDQMRLTFITSTNSMCNLSSMW